MKFLYAFLFLVVALVRSEKECRCSVVLIGDGNVLVAYEDETLALDHDNCNEDEECATKCYDTLYEGTNHGDFDYKPPEIHGMTVGDYGCLLFGTDIQEGYGYGFSKLCDHLWRNTSFTFNGAFCCEGGKHVKNHERCG